MNIFNIMRELVIASLNQLVDVKFLPAELSFDAVTAEPPRDSSHGDISTNAAMVVAKKAGKNPRDVAVALIEILKKDSRVASAQVAGPGFINLTLKPEVWCDVVREVVSSGLAFGNSTVGKNKKVNVEYVSANPTGPMHIGHARGAVIGDVLARLLLKAGYNITKEYYINDAGGQIEKLVASAFYRYREAAGEAVGEIEEGMYPGEYLKIVGESFYHLHGRKYAASPLANCYEELKQFTLDAMMTLIKNDLRDLGILHDVYTSEAKVMKRLEEAFAVLKSKDLIYSGVLEPPKGMVVEDYEAKPQMLFRASQFGDDVDRPLAKSDGSTTYFAGDIAYHFDKVSRGFDELVLMLGVDHGGYVKRLKAAVKALSDNKVEMDILLYQLVNFLDGGVPIKMSKRAGTFITVRDVLDAVGKDAIRFMMLTRKNDAPLDFDLQKVVEQSKDNPVFYVQYAYARIQSVFGHVAEDIPELAQANLSEADLSRLTDVDEISLIKTISQWPRVVEAAALSREPHRITYYLQELAGQFHALWNKGKEHANLRFIIVEEKEKTLARLALLKATSETIASGFQVLGVTPMVKM